MGCRNPAINISTWHRESQGAQLMAKFGINVPDGEPAFSVKDVENAAKQLADEKGEVRAGPGMHGLRSFDLALACSNLNNLLVCKLTGGRRGP